MVSEEGAVGTGVVINARCIVTAAHVAGTPMVTVTTLSGKDYVLKRVAYDSASDVAAACADTPLNQEAATFGPTPPLYSPVFTIGFPLGESYILTEGRWQEGDLITAQCAPGNSGGGVFDSKGRDIGFVDTIRVYQYREGLIGLPHLCGIVDGVTVQKFLTTNNIEYHHE